LFNPQIVSEGVPQLEKKGDSTQALVEFGVFAIDDNADAAMDVPINVEDTILDNVPLSPTTLVTILELNSARLAYEFNAEPTNIPLT
jgi:hypothetical protein